jgi:hypothetical protein
MVIKIESYNKVLTAEIPDSSDIGEVMDSFNGLLVACTYQMGTINDYIIGRSEELKEEEDFYEN